MSDKTKPHWVLIGGGSAAFAATYEARALGARVTMCNQGLPLGGTCPNVGCIPSKTLIRAAEALHRARHTGFHGLKLEAELLDFAAVIEQKRNLVDTLIRSNYIDAMPGWEDFELVPHRARLVGPRTVHAGDRTLEADYVLVATGTSATPLPLPGLDHVDYLDNVSAFELSALPKSLLVLGGGYIALECAQMFHRFGSRVTLLQRSAHVLSDQPGFLGEGLADHLRDEGMQVVCGTSLQQVEEVDGQVQVHATVGGKQRTFSAERVLVATGRSPNTADLGLEAQGVELTPGGYVAVNARMETSVAGVYAAGDVVGKPEFVYTASYEAELAVRNALTGSQHEADYTALPWVVFTDPQVAGVGLDEASARAKGFDAESATLPANRWPSLKVARNTRGFLTLVRDKKTDLLLGAQILAPEGGDLVSELSLAMRHGITVCELADSFHPYLTLSEGIQRAAQRFS